LTDRDHGKPTRERPARGANEVHNSEGQHHEFPQ
jgi:hypothetical protein